nr:hypothetical protein B0A51_04476 [Rachicladosporium sp. CCFEE 5018]
MQQPPSRASSDVIFSREVALEQCSLDGDHLPGHPDVLLSHDAVDRFVDDEMGTRELDALAPYLWLVTKKASTNVDALHRQGIKQRRITVTEDPKLHLVWTVDRVFIKPIPTCLLSYNFWDRYLSPRTDPVKAQTIYQAPHLPRQVALGFLRSYALLIRHKSDLRIAKAEGLVPDDISWNAWARFIVHFRYIADEEVSTRHHYGQMRLSRLNVATRAKGLLELSPRWGYEATYWSTLPYIIDAAAPVFFLFAGLSLVMSAMQVMLAASDTPRRTSDAYGAVFWNFSIIVVVSSLVAMLLFLLVPAVYILNQHVWGYRHRHGTNATRPTKRGERSV